MSEQETKIKDKPNSIWLKLDYSSNPWKNLAVELPPTLRDATFEELVNFLSSDKSKLSAEERKTLEGFCGYIKNPKSLIYTRHKENKTPINRSDKVTHYIFPNIVILGETSIEIDLLDIIAEHHLNY